MHKELTIFEVQQNKPKQEKKSKYLYSKPLKVLVFATSWNENISYGKLYMTFLNEK